MSYLAKNNAISTLAAGISDVATSLSVQTGHGDRFPVIVGPDYTYITLENSGGTREIVKVTARALGSDTFTIVRAQDNTTAVAWLSADVVELRLPAVVVQEAFDHINDATAAHAASAISFTPSGTIASTDVQAAIAELGTEKAIAGPLASSGITGAAASGANSDITSLMAVTGITAGTVTVAAGDLVYVQDVSAANELKVVTAQSIADVGTGKRLAQSPVVATLTTVATTTANIPQDDTIPQITEGTEILTAAITPVNASNTLFITCQVWASMSAGNWCSVALFKDSTANALAAGRAFINGAGQTELITFSHSLSAGSTSAITFRIRVGAQASETVTVNGAGGVRIFGGAMYSRITIEEITA